MTKIIFFTSCQYDAVKMMREDIYSPIKTVSSLWPDFRLTCANVCFLFPPSFTTKLIRLNMIKPRLTGNLTNSFNRETPFTQT